MALTVGSILYKVNENNSVDLVRVMRFKNQNLIIVKDKENELYKMTMDDVKKYKKLKEDGILNIARVNIQNSSDVIISLNRINDLENGINIPYYACRQNINDIFATQIIKDNNTYVGVGMSKDTCPPDIPFETVLICDEVVENMSVSIYKEDSLEDMLELFKLTKFNDLLSHTYENRPPQVYGFCKSVKDLLIDNEFMYDFKTAFDIKPIDIAIFSIGELSDLDPVCIPYMEDILRHKIIRPKVFRYTRNIEEVIKAYKGEHVLVEDTTNTVYAICYIKGDYINRQYTSMHDDTELRVMRRLKYNCTN